MVFLEEDDEAVGEFDASGGLGLEGVEGRDRDGLPGFGGLGLGGEGYEESGG
jgi:hypothetical protein